MQKETISVMCFQNNKTKDTQPDYVVRAKVGEEFIEVGAGWKKTTSKGTMFLSLSLDADGLKKVYKDKYDKLTSAGTPVPTFEPISAREAEINPDQVFNAF
jgi:uncharacterized protein (DUF736 family)